MYIDRCMWEYILEYEKEECLAIGIIDMSQWEIFLGLRGKTF